MLKGHARSEGAIAVAVLLAGAVLLVTASATGASTYYVRQTVGDDTNDGLTPETAWRRISKLTRSLGAGDTAYVGPGLYRDSVGIANVAGSADKGITVIADSTGEHTGDPPGTVMVAGAEPVDENIFAPHSAPGVYTARLRVTRVFGVVEMDGAQHRYENATYTAEYLRENLPGVDVVVKLPSTFFYDAPTETLYVHTSDGQHPNTHEIELVRRMFGFAVSSSPHVTIVGFTFRHQGDTGIYFFEGSEYGVAIGNTSYGSRMGIRVHSSPNVTVFGNTLFGNENSGVYFLAKSTNGAAIGNVSFENVKGVRWTSESANGRTIDNVLFENLEAGVAIEEAGEAVVIGNRIVNNKKSQLMARNSRQRSEGNCFENGSPDQLLADLHVPRCKTLAEYQKETGQDLTSREGACGEPPKRPDVQKLHVESTTYAERARERLRQGEQSQEAAAGGGGDRQDEGEVGWLEWLLGR